MSNEAVLTLGRVATGNAKTEPLSDCMMSLEPNIVYCGAKRILRTADRSYALVSSRQPKRHCLRLHLSLERDASRWVTGSNLVVDGGIQRGDFGFIFS